MKTASPSGGGNGAPASEGSSVCAPFAPSADVFTDPLERALVLAAEAGRFDVVAKLADEIHARRLVASGVAEIRGSRSRS